VTAHDDELLAEQRRFYAVEAADYDAYFVGLLDPDNPEPRAVEFRAAQDRTRALLGRLAPLGDVLELAGGTGVLTDLVLPLADRLTVVDASAPSLELARRRTARHGRSGDVEWVEADVFTWPATAGRTFDTVCFSAWLHHVPEPRFDAFWDSLRPLLAPGGRVVFDFQTGLTAPVLDPASPPVEDYRIYQAVDGISHRDHLGRRWRIVHVVWSEAELAARLAGLGWAVEPAGPGWSTHVHWAIATPMARP
jgi:SAM-dependent methyltransferase